MSECASNRASKSERQFCEASPPDSADPGWRVLAIRLAVFLLLLIGPVKFGSPTGLPEVPLFPNDPVLWLFFSWPPILFPLFAGALLLVSVFLLKAPQASPQVVSLLWFAVAIVSFLGFIHCGTYDLAILQCAHFFGLAAFSFAVFQLVEASPAAGRPLLGAIVVSTLLVAVYGYHQYFYGLQETRNYVYEQELATGYAINSELKARLGLNQVFSFFAISNSFAAHLILTLPLCAWAVAIYVWNCVPSRTLSVLGAVSMSILLGGILALSGSRAAFVSLAVALGFAGAVVIVKALSWRVPLRGRNVVLACSLAALCALISVVAVWLIITQSDKGKSSFSARSDYYQVAVELTVRHPWCGAGWGNFFHRYCEMKHFADEESPHNAHNFPLMMGAEAGVLGFCCALALLLIPILLLLLKFWRSDHEDGFRRYLPIAALVGWSAWALHNLMDVDIQIPTTCATATAILAIALLDGERRILPRLMPILRYWRVGALCVAAVAVVFPLWRLPAEAAYQNLNDLCSARPSSPDGFRSGVELWQVKERLSRCVELAPYSPYPWAVAGMWAQQQRMWDSGEEFYAEAVKRSPLRASYYYRLAMCQALQGDARKRAEARKNFDLAAKYFPFAYGEKALREKLLKSGIQGVQ